MAFTQPPAPEPFSSRVSSLRHGQKVDPGTGIGVPFTEQDMEAVQATALIGDANTEITPTFRAQSLVRIGTIPSTEILSFYRAWFENDVAIDLPQVLEAATTVYESSAGEGTSDETADGVSVGDNPNLAITLNASAQSSASLIPDLNLAITPRALSRAPVKKYQFFIADNATEAQILTRLTAMAGATVNAWPFFDQSQTVYRFILKGEQASVSAGAKAQQSISAGDTDTYIKSEGTSSSYQVGNSLKIITTPPVINASLTIASATATQAIDAEATADMEAGTNWPGFTVTKTASYTVSAEVSPTSIPHTDPVQAIPASGLYAYKINQEPSPWPGYMTVYATVFDFANA